ncbi:helix-turn-helix domain-containing protein [Nonomuraea bangladeshensis]
MPSAAMKTGPVVARALQILGAFTSDRRSLTLSDLSRHSGLPVSTVHRLVAELLAWGALERDHAGC